MKLLSNSNDKVTVFAARSGLSVEAITEIMERMKRIESRFHNGQFCRMSVEAPTSKRDGLPKDHWGRR